MAALNDDDQTYNLRGEQNPIVKKVGQLLWLGSLAISVAFVWLMVIETVLTIAYKKYPKSIFFEILAPTGCFLISWGIVYALRSRVKRRQRSRDVLSTIKAVFDLILSVGIGVYGAYNKGSQYGNWHRLVAGWTVSCGCFASSVVGCVLCQRSVDAFSAFSSNVIPIFLYFASEKRIVMVVACGFIYFSVVGGVLMHYGLSIQQVEISKRWAAFFMYGFVWGGIFGILGLFGKPLLNLLVQDHSSPVPPPSSCH